MRSDEADTRGVETKIVVVDVVVVVFVAVAVAV
jgi:hypothetical protein